LETSLSRQSLALVLTTQNRQEKIHQKNTKNKLAWGKNKQNPQTQPKPAVTITHVETTHVCAYNCVQL